MRVLKFGGSSVSSADRIKGVMQIVQNKYNISPSVAVVVSALGGVTDTLMGIARQAARGDGAYQDIFTQLQKRHLDLATALISPSRLASAHEHIKTTIKELEDALRGIALVWEVSKRTMDYVLSFGERLSAYIIAESLKETIPSAIYVDARDLITTDRHFGSAHVLYERTYRTIKDRLPKGPSLPIITGFIGATEAQETTTLGRGGSDYTAAIIGAAINAEEIEIWTDVDGVMTADPRQVQAAFPIPHLTYKEALEMSHFGAKVIHPPTIVPALQHNIPLRIRNTFRPEAPGTLITAEDQAKSNMICGISSINEVALVRVEGSGMVGVCGSASRIFGALAKSDINVILISQGSSEHSICFAIAPHSAERAIEAIEEEFSLEMHAGLIDKVVVEDGVSVIAIVGGKMRHTPGIAGKLFGALGNNGINIAAIVQGSSEYNISVAVKRSDEVKALNVIHEEFFLSPATTLNLFLVGTGLIGKTLLQQIRCQAESLRHEYALDLRVVGLANSTKMCFNDAGCELEHWQDQLKKATESMHITSFVRHMKGLNLANSIFVDCTSSEEVAAAYEEILSASVSIVTPNKKAMSGPYDTYRILKDLTKRKGVKFLYETNVGAGLPIISTVIDLLRSGDKILKVEAVLSGTLSYLFNTFMSGKTLSESVHEAQQRGFTEPDPRDDLNGKDVLRKLLILARESGFPLEITDIALEPLLPSECFEASAVAEFYRKLTAYDEVYEQKRSQLTQEGRALRYIASFENGIASVALQAVAADHPFYHLSGSDNVIALTTERYKENPLVIKGQGAGAEVTAGEVLADIIRIGTH